MTSHSDLRKAAEMALEALQKIYIAPEHEEYIQVWWPKCEEAMQALRQALAQAEQELFTAKQIAEAVKAAIKFSKREWVGLTDEEVESWRGNYDFFDSALVRKVEAKLKEKNNG